MPEETQSTSVGATPSFTSQPWAISLFAGVAVALLVVGLWAATKYRQQAQRRKEKGKEPIRVEIELPELQKVDNSPFFNNFISPVMGLFDTKRSPDVESGYGTASPNAFSSPEKGSNTLSLLPNSTPSSPVSSKTPQLFDNPAPGEITMIDIHDVGALEAAENESRSSSSSQ